MYLDLSGEVKLQSVCRTQMCCTSLCCFHLSVLVLLFTYPRLAFIIFFLAKLYFGLFCLYYHRRGERGNRGAVAQYVGVHLLMAPKPVNLT